MNVLLIEDENRIAEFIVRGLKGDGFVVTHAMDGETGLEYLKDNTFDVVILDLMLPGMSGYDVCRKIRIRKNFTPILMLSALDEMDDRIQGLNLGADDYLTKPFDFDELVARLNALKRRNGEYTKGVSESEVLESGNISYNKQTFHVRVKGRSVELTEKEREMLALFLANPNRVISRERILNSIWGANADPLTNVVDVYIGRLRKKMRIDKDQLKNIRGVGYQFCPE